MKSLEEKIVELGRDAKYADIQQLVEKVQVKEIISMLKENLFTSTNSLIVLNHLVKGFSGSGPSNMKRLQITEFILEELHKRCIQSQHAYCIVTLLISELDKYPTAHLVKIYDLCMDYMQQNSVSGSSFWKDILPKIITVLSEKDTLSYAGSEIPGSEFKEIVVEKLCRIHWKGEKITAVVSVLTDISLNEKVMAQVVAKVGKWLQELKAPEVPPLAHHLFRMCHKVSGCTLTIFLHLRDYFSKHLYYRENQAAPSRQDDDSIFSELECEGYGVNSVSEMRLAEGTVLYHIEQAAILGSPLIQNLLNSLKSITNQPEIIIDPFIITVLMHLSLVSVYQSQILDILWAAIKCCIEDEEGKTESAWFRDMVPTKCKLDDVIKLVVDKSASGRDKVTSGLMSLGMKLLSTSPPLSYAPPSQNSELVNPETWIRHCFNVKERMIHRAWRIGSTLLLLLARKDSTSATPVLKTILMNIIAGKTPTTIAHLTGCLAKMSSSMPLMMLDNQSILIEKMSSLMLIGGELNEDEEGGLNVCQEVVFAILPLVKISSYIRDSLVLIMRKSMFSRSIASREVAVTGFLHMLKYLKVEDFGALSQSSQSNFSAPSSNDPVNVLIHSQGYNKKGNTNESTYLEILNVVRRCLVLQPEVRKCLYEGFPSAVNQNPELGSHLLEFLYHHLVNFLIDLDKNIGDQLTSPLNWSKIVRVVGKEACLKEPIASLLWCTQLLLLSGSDLDNPWPSECDAVLHKVKKILKALVLQVGKCAPSDYGLEETYDFTVASSETEEKKIIIRQLFGVHEALISYVIGSWRKHLNEPGENLISLMNAYSRLEVFVSRIKLAETEAKGKQKKGKEDGDGPSKKPASSNKLSAQLIPAPVLDAHCTLKFLQLLFNDVPEIDVESVSTKIKQNLHIFVIKAALHHIHQSRVKNFYHRRRFTSVKHCYDIICIIYKNCVSKFLEYATFHKNCALMVLECLCEMIALDASYHKLATMLDEEGNFDTDNANSGASPVKKCICHLQSLLEMLIEKENEEDSEKDAWFNMPFLVASCIAYLSSQCMPSPDTTSDSTLDRSGEELLTWFGRFVKERSPKNPKVAKLMVSHLFVLGNRWQYSALDLPFEKIIKQLGSSDLFGRVDENEENNMHYKIINDAIKYFTFSLLCQEMKIILEEVDRMLKRLKSECDRLQMLHEPLSGNAAEKLTGQEKEVITRLIHCGQLANKLAQVATPAGPLHASFLKLIADLYSCAIQLARYFIRRSSNRPSSLSPVFDGTRFEKLVQILGTHLSSNVSLLRTYVQDAMEEAEKKKKGVKAQNITTVRNTSLLVFTTEKFEKVIIQLSKKTKVNLSAMVKLGTSRDFRIDQQKLTENLKLVTQGEAARGSDEDDPDEINSEGEQEEQQPARKRARFKS